MLIDTEFFFTNSTYIKLLLYIKPRGKKKRQTMVCMLLVFNKVKNSVRNVVLVSSHISTCVLGAVPYLLIIKSLNFRYLFRFCVKNVVS